MFRPPDVLGPCCVRVDKNVLQRWSSGTYGQGNHHADSAGRILLVLEDAGKSLSGKRSSSSLQNTCLFSVWQTTGYNISFCLFSSFVLHDPLNKSLLWTRSCCIIVIGDLFVFLIRGAGSMSNSYSEDFNVNR